jgi:hypothetical protein
MVIFLKMLWITNSQLPPNMASVHLNKHLKTHKYVLARICSSKSSDMAYRGISKEKFISYNLYSLPNLTGNFCVDGPIIPIKQIFDTTW